MNCVDLGGLAWIEPGHERGCPAARRPRPAAS
jgi:hypothetical protein